MDLSAHLASKKLASLAMLRHAEEDGAADALGEGERADKPRYRVLEPSSI
jgi:hypothetical protein